MPDLPGRVQAAGYPAWNLFPPSVEQVREAIEGNSDRAIEGTRLLLRHAALCTYLTRSECPSCSAIIEATEAGYA